MANKHLSPVNGKWAPCHATIRGCHYRRDDSSYSDGNVYTKEVMLQDDETGELKVFAKGAPVNNNYFIPHMTNVGSDAYSATIMQNKIEQAYSNHYGGTTNVITAQKKIFKSNQSLAKMGLQEARVDRARATDRFLRNVFSGNWRSISSDLSNIKNANDEVKTFKTARNNGTFRSGSGNGSSSRSRPTAYARRRRQRSRRIKKVIATAAIVGGVVAAPAVVAPWLAMGVGVSLMGDMVKRQRYGTFLKKAGSNYWKWLRR